MFSKTTLFALLGSAAVANAAVADFFNGPNCSGSSYSRNIYDNTCAPTGGFQSFRITSGGGSGQTLTTYSRNACAGQTYASVGAGDVGTCHNSYGNDNSGSNAVSSYSG